MERHSRGGIAVAMCAWRWVILSLVVAHRIGAEPVQCWGLNDHGQGDVPADLGDVAIVSLGFQHACALQTVGTVVCWGSNAEGQSTVPAGLTGVAGVVAGGYHTCAWHEDGAVTCWGKNDHGQTTVPSGLGTVLGVTSGYNNNCVWNTDQIAHCWGQDVAGETAVPAGLMNVQGVALGAGSHACAWDSSYVATCWGDDSLGQATPFNPSRNGYVQLAVGGAHSCGLRLNGKIKCWGSGSNQQLNVPGFFNGGLNLAAGTTHTCGGRNGIMCWGDDADGTSEVPPGLTSGPPMKVTAFARTTCAWEEKVTTTTATTSTLTATTVTSTTSTTDTVTTQTTTLTMSTTSTTFSTTTLTTSTTTLTTSTTTLTATTTTSTITYSTITTTSTATSTTVSSTTTSTLSTSITSTTGTTTTSATLTTTTLSTSITSTTGTTTTSVTLTTPTTTMTTATQTLSSTLTTATTITATTTTTTATGSTTSTTSASTTTTLTSSTTTATSTTSVTSSTTTTATATTVTTITATATGSTTTSTTTMTSATSSTTISTSSTFTTSSSSTGTLTTTSTSTLSTTTSTSSISTSSTTTGSATTTTVTATSFTSTSTNTSTATTRTATATSSSTTTTTSSGPDTFFTQVDADVHNSSRELVKQARTQPGRWVQQTSVGLAEAVTIKPENLTTDGSFINIGNAALAPVELLRSYVEEEGDDIVIVVTRVSNPAYLLQKVIDHGGDLGEIHGMVEITLYNRRTGQHIDTNEKLDRSVLIKLSDDPEPSGRLDGACVFVDDDTWSTEAMGRAESAELDSSSRNAMFRSAQVDVDDLSLVSAEELDTSGVWCTTRNLGINAFLLGPPLQCAGASVVMQEDLPHDDEDHPWMTSRPALLCFALLLFLACCHVYALRSDRRFRKTADTWSDRRLDTLIMQLTPEVRGPNGKPGHERFEDLVPASNQSRQLRETPSTPPSALPYYPYVTMALLIRCSLVAERHAVPLEGVPSELLRSSFGPWGYNRRCWIFFRAFHPLLTLGDPPFMSSCVKNAKLMTDSVLFPLCALCLVFSATGEMLAAGSDPGCVPQGFAGGWVFFISGLSTFLCGLPSRFQACCFARHDPEQRPSCRMNTCFWILELLWTVLHLVITLIFLSCVAPVDRWKWEVLLVLVLLFVFLLKPLLIAFFLALWTSIVVRLWPELLQDPPPDQSSEGNANPNDELSGLDEVGRDTVRNLAHRGISIAHLLDFYQKLGTVVMPQFDPAAATTEDVVRQAIIPLSRGNVNEVYGQPLKVKLGILRMSEHPGRNCDMFIRCEVQNRPMAVLDTWAVPAAALRQVDWSMEAELLGYQPGDCLELSLVEADTGRKVCTGRLRCRLLDGQHEVPLVNSANAPLGTILLQITPPVNAAAPTVPRAPVQPVAYQSQGYFEWCGANDVEHPAIPELGWVMPDCKMGDAAKNVRLGDVEIRFSNRMDPSEDMFGPASPRAGARTITGASYASSVNVPLLPNKMVTHNWSNCFAHLIATVFADALGQETYGQLLPMLVARDTAKLRSLLGAAGKLDKSYWIDAFSVNQHMSVCNNTPQLVDSMGMRIVACTCSTPKIAAGPQCENDKMPYMMSFVNALWAERGGEFEHVVAVDPGHTLFGRTWCIAELHEAHQANMHQTFVLHSFDDLDAQATRSVVEGIDIRTSKSSYEEDKTHLLSLIDDAEAYNERVRSLVNTGLRSNGAVPAEKISLTTWLLDALLI